MDINFGHHPGILTTLQELWSCGNSILAQLALKCPNFKPLVTWWDMPGWRPKLRMYSSVNSLQDYIQFYWICWFNFPVSKNKKEVDNATPLNSNNKASAAQSSEATNNKKNASIFARLFARSKSQEETKALNNSKAGVSNPPQRARAQGHRSGQRKCCRRPFRTDRKGVSRTYGANKKLRVKLQYLIGRTLDVNQPICAFSKTFNFLIITYEGT